MGKKMCELCCGVARMFCESDQASLCWNCDGKVHGANFLVAKHTRCLLCSACQSPTPWKASGLRLCPTLSICESCVARKNLSNGRDLTRQDDDAESYNEDEEEIEEEEAENQVVPWDAGQQPSPVSSGDGGLVMKRTRRDSDLNCSDEESNVSRPVKRLSRERHETSSRSTATMNSVHSNGCPNSD